MPVVKLDQTTVWNNHCPKGARKLVLTDSHITGFICEIYPSGSRTYALKYKNKYKDQRQFKIGNAADLTCDQARKVAAKARARVVQGQDPAEEREVDRRTPTIAELADRYLDYVRTYKKSHDIDERYLRKHVVPMFGKKHLNELGQEEVLDWLDAKVRKDGYAQATVNRWQVILSHMYKMAKKWGVPGAERNPLEGVSQKPVDNQMERFLTADETKRLVDAVDASANTQLGAIVRLLLLTGCRKRELLDAKWSEIDLDKQVWRIPMERAKTSKTRHVPLSEQAMGVLRSLRRWEGCDYVVPNPDTHKPYHSIHFSWDRARKEAGLADVRIHDCRHSFASWLVEAGYSIYIVSKALGHASSRTTERYAHVSDTTLRSASNAAANLIGNDWATA
jgi:integrase